MQALARAVRERRRLQLGEHSGDQRVVGALEAVQLRDAREDLLEAGIERDHALVESEGLGPLAALLDQRGQVEQRRQVVRARGDGTPQQRLGGGGLVQRAVQVRHAHQGFLGLVDAEGERAAVLGQRRARRIGLREHFRVQVAEQRDLRVRAGQALVGATRQRRVPGAQRELGLLGQVARFPGPAARQGVQHAQRAAELAALHQRPGEQLQRLALPGFVREQRTAGLLGLGGAVLALELPRRREQAPGGTHAQTPAAGGWQRHGGG